MNIKLLRLVPQILAVVLTMFGMAACSATASAPTDTSTKASEPQSEELNPNNADGYVERGNICHEEGKKTNAISNFYKAIELNPKLATAYVGRGNVYYDQGEKTKAIKDYSKAIELNPNYADATVGV